MKKLNPYTIAFVVGSSASILLSVASRAAPLKTASALPLGGDDFLQYAIVTFPLFAVAAVVDLFGKGGQ